jgi:hypothetical protein
MSVFLRTITLALLAACNLPNLPFINSGGGGGAPPTGNVQTTTESHTQTTESHTETEEINVNGRPLHPKKQPTEAQTPAPQASKGKAFGDACELNTDCASGLCIVKNKRGPQVGFCSARCKNEWDCQKLGGGYASDWKCADVSNVSQNVCFPDRS